MRGRSCACSFVIITVYQAVLEGTYNNRFKPCVCQFHLEYLCETMTAILVALFLLFTDVSITVMYLIIICATHCWCIMYHIQPTTSFVSLPGWIDLATKKSFRRESDVNFNPPGELQWSWSCFGNDCCSCLLNIAPTMYFFFTFLFVYKSLRGEVIKTDQNHPSWLLFGGKYP